MVSDELIAQHKRRLSYMPWLYFSLKERHLEWARPWQEGIQTRIKRLETVEIAEGCFVAPDAMIFAEPGRAVKIGEGSAIASGVFLHGPAVIGRRVSLNQGVILDGGKAGIEIGDDARIAAGAKLFAFDHQTSLEETISRQAVTSRGIRIGRDVWIGAGAGVTDGVTIGDQAIVGMGAVVTRDVSAGQKMGGVPARAIGWRV